MGERELRRRIGELENQLRRLRQEQETQRERIRTRYQRQIREIESRLRTIESANAQRIRALREEMAAAMQREVAEIQAADRRSQREREELLRELREINEELQRQLEELKSQELEREGRGRQAAEELIAEAKAQADAVNGEPHAFFCPGRYAVLLEHLDTAQTMLDKALFDAAAAMADAAACELTILGIDVRERQREWETIYDLYQTLAVGLWETVKRFEGEPIQTPSGEFRLTEEERAYWSGGTYQGIRERVESYYTLVRGIQAAGGVTAYLNGNTPAKGFRLSRQITELHRLCEELTAVISCIRSERTYSDQRYEYAFLAENALTEKGYHSVRADFRDGEPLDSYELVVSVNGLDMLKVLFVPVRRDGVVVQNMAIVEVDVKTIPNPTTIQKTAESVLRLLRGGAFEGLPGIWFNAKDTRCSMEERRRKAQPDVKKLARRLERKYQ